MRGTLVEIMVDLRCDGIIPAYAGNTMCATPALPSTRDHPRVCGEHVKRVHRHRHAIRIIPAYAGNTTPKPTTKRRRKDHPRVCGEHNCSRKSANCALGSSPRMRGTRCHGVVRSLSPGIIPAYAGNTRGTASKATKSRDHPRVCGEHSLSMTSPLISTGSSPRMRGTH